jgi:hypothetical protein
VIRIARSPVPLVGFGVVVRTTALLITKDFLGWHWLCVNFTYQRSVNSKGLLGFGVGFGKSYKSLITSTFLALAKTGIPITF